MNDCLAIIYLVGMAATMCAGLVAVMKYCGNDESAPYSVGAVTGLAAVSWPLFWTIFILFYGPFMRWLKAFLENKLRRDIMDIDKEFTPYDC